MIEAEHANRWFGANPQATSSQGKNLHGWNRATPKDWRTALGVAEEPPKDPGDPGAGGGYQYPEPPRHRGRIAVVVVVVAVVAAALGWIFGGSSSSSSGPNLTATVNATTAQGGHDFVNFACSACHGMQGKGGPDKSVPVLTSIGATKSPAQISAIINDGLGGVANASGGTNAPYMPTWRNILSAQQVSDLVAYIQAGLPVVPGATEAVVPSGQGNVVAGSVIFDNFGCENCHGANGLGGVVNPSPDGTIPPLGGAAFSKEFPPQTIIDVIKSGSIIGKNPITSMPHWGGIIPDAQLQQLVAYIQTLPGPSK